MTNRVKVGAGETAPVETKAYSAMLYALADEMRREEGCITMSPGGPGRVIDCMKCEACGWSQT